MDILVIDGQGGGIGKNIVEKLKARMGNSINVIAVGTNSLATSAMIKGGADNIATGENAIIYNAQSIRLEKSRRCIKQTRECA